MQAKPVTSILVKPLGSQVETQAPAPARPQTPAQAHPQARAQAQPSWLAQTHLHVPQPQAAVCLLVRQAPSDSHDKDSPSLDFPMSKTSLIAKQARSELLDRVTTFCTLERLDTEDQNKVLGMQNLVTTFIYTNPESKKYLRFALENKVYISSKYFPSV